MKLGKLFEDVDFVNLTQEQKEMEVKGVKINPDKVSKGDVCLFLKENLPEEYRHKVFDNGGVLLIEQNFKENNSSKHHIYSNRTRELFSLLSKKLNNDACDRLKIIGITGTNGKTTVANMVGSILNASGHKTGVIGTLGCFYDNLTQDVGLTTPDPDVLHEQFANMLKCGCEYVVMEVSAHAIALKKLEGITFDLMALTNVTQDHLDFFKTMDRYASIKMSIFNDKHIRQAVICVDDKYGRELSDKTNLPYITYGLNNPADVFGIDIQQDVKGTKFICNCLDNVFICKSKFIGDFNVENILCATSICALCGIDVNQINKCIGRMEPVEGRVNLIDVDGVQVVIDYAHTPDGIANVLKSVSERTDGKLYCLFGCGGNRDKSKRSLMGSNAELFADKVFLTSDNPRDENPSDIISDIKQGFIGNDYIVEEDRRKAIKIALGECHKGDCLVIAGKGSEKYQEVQGKKLPFSDFEVVQEYIEEKLNNSPQKEKVW